MVYVKGLSQKLSKTVAQLHQKVQDLEAREDIFKKESDLVRLLYLIRNPAAKSLVGIAKT